MSAAMAADLIPFILAITAGLAAGSYLIVLTTRLPMRIFAADAATPEGWVNGMIDVSSKRSLCPKCGAQIAWHDNIPLLSYLLLRGQCRACEAPISLRYPLAEIAGAVAAMVAFYSYGPTWQAGFVAGFLLILIAVSIIDIETGLIPDILSVGGLGIGLIYAALSGWGTFAESIWATAAGFGALWALAFAYERATGREGMGRGDFKLAAMLGAWLGLSGLWLALTLAFLSGTWTAMTLMVSRKETMQMEIPFGPFLCFGGTVAFLLEARGIDWLATWTNFVLGF